MYVISPRVVFISNWVVGPKKHPLLKCWSTISPVEAKTGENSIPVGDRTFIYLGVKRTQCWEYMGITKNVHWALYQGHGGGQGADPRRGAVQPRRSVWGAGAPR